MAPEAGPKFRGRCRMKTRPRITSRTRDAEIQAVADVLRKDLPEDPESWTPVHKATNLLAEMLGYHRREEKCGLLGILPPARPGSR